MIRAAQVGWQAGRVGARRTEAMVRGRGTAGRVGRGQRGQVKVTVTNRRTTVRLGGDMGQGERWGVHMHRGLAAEAAVVCQAATGGEAAATPAPVGHVNRARAGRLSETGVPGEVVGQSALAPATHPCCRCQLGVTSIDVPLQALAHGGSITVCIARATALHRTQEHSRQGEGKYEAAIAHVGLGVHRPGRGHARGQGHYTGREVGDADMRHRENTGEPRGERVARNGTEKQ